VSDAPRPDAALATAPVRVSAEIGRTEMSVARVLDVTDGQIIELDHAADAPANLYVNGRRLGTGRLVLVDGEWALRIEWLAGEKALGSPSNPPEASEPASEY
jgi:flagellar motor switch protein FliN